MDSGYPTREVVKTASPEMFDFAPKDFPWKTGPSWYESVVAPHIGLCRNVLGW
jgi:hypothetical protein